MAATATARPYSLSVWRPLMTSEITVRMLESFVRTIYFKHFALCCRSNLAGHREIHCATAPAPVEGLPSSVQQGFGLCGVGYIPRVAVTESREVVIEATPDEIMDVLLDLESLTEWSSAHQEVEILERDDQAAQANLGRSSKSWASVMSRYWTTPFTTTA